MDEKVKYFTKELQFLLELTDYNSDKKEIIIRYIDNDINLNVFESEGIKHRLYLPAGRILLDHKELIPQEMYDKIKKQTNKLSKNVLRINAESKRIRKIFFEHNIDNVVIKGPELTETLYGNPLDRFTRDIDLVIPIENFENALNILDELGYVLTPPFDKFSKDQINLVFKDSNQLQFKNKNSNVILELHWKIIKHSFMSDDFRNNFNQYKEYADFSKINIYNTMFLMIHGSFHNWNRLFWLRDIRYILSKKLIDIGKLLELAKELNMINIFNQTLLMLEYVYKHNISTYKNGITNKNYYSRDLSLYLLNHEGDKLPYLMTYKQIYYRMSLNYNIKYKWQVLKSQIFRISDLHNDRKYWFISYPLAPFTRYFKFLKKQDAKRKA